MEWAVKNHNHPPISPEHLPHPATSMEGLALSSMTNFTYLAMVSNVYCHTVHAAPVVAVESIAGQC